VESIENRGESMTYVVMHGRRIRELREEKRLSQRELAEAAGISVCTLRKVEHEEPVRKSTARKVAAALGIGYQTIAQPHYTGEQAARTREFLRENASRLFPELTDRPAQA
jgi:transcriptional regulator with XRE-family HTH domain